MRFHVFGEFRYLDYPRLAGLFPARLVVPGHHRKSWGDEDRFVRYNPSAIACRVEYKTFNVFGHVPVGLFVRGDISRFIVILKDDMLACLGNEASQVMVVFCILFA